MPFSKPVFLRGKSSLLSMGDGRVYWQVGDVPPRGGELWSSDVWWEDLTKQKPNKNMRKHNMWFKYSTCIVVVLSNDKEYLRVPEFWMVDKRMIGSIAGRVLGWFAQQKLLEFLLHFVTGHRTCETKRRNQTDWGHPRAMTHDKILLILYYNTNFNLIMAWNL